MTVGVVTERITEQSGARAPIELAASLARIGVRTILYANAEGQDRETVEYLTRSAVRIRVVDGTTRGWAAARKLRSLLREDRPDLLSLHARLPFAYAAWRSRLPRVQTYYGTQLNVLHERFFPWRSWLWPFEWLLNVGIWKYVALQLRLASTVVAMNEFTADDARRRYGVRTRSIPLGSTTPRLTPTGRAVPPHPFTILSVSRFTPYKNFHLILDAFAELRRAVPDAECILAGIPERGAYLDSLRRRAGAGVSFRIRPNDAELTALYESSDAYVTADRNLFFGLPVAEAAAFSRPVVAWDFAAAREMVRDGETGFVVASVGAFAERLVRLAQHPVLRQQLGDAGRRHAAEHFRWERTAEAYRDLFHSMLKR